MPVIIFSFIKYLFTIYNCNIYDCVDDVVRLWLCGTGRSGFSGLSGLERSLLTTTAYGTGTLVYTTCWVGCGTGTGTG